jgi:hypothetical protein
MVVSKNCGTPIDKVNSFIRVRWPAHFRLTVDSHALTILTVVPFLETTKITTARHRKLQVTKNSLTAFHQRLKRGGGVAQRLLLGMRRGGNAFQFLGALPDRQERDFSLVFEFGGIDFDQGGKI